MLPDFKIDLERQRMLYNMLTDSDSTFLVRMGFSSDQRSALQQDVNIVSLENRAQSALVDSTYDSVLIHSLFLSLFGVVNTTGGNFIRDTEVHCLRPAYLDEFRREGLRSSGGAGCIPMHSTMYCSSWTTKIAPRVVEACSQACREADANQMVGVLRAADWPSVAKNPVFVRGEDQDHTVETCGNMFHNWALPRSAFLRIVVGTGKDGKPAMLFIVNRISRSWDLDRPVQPDEPTRVFQTSKVVKSQTFTSFVVAMKTTIKWVMGADIKDLPGRDKINELIDGPVHRRAEIFNERFKEILQELYGEQAKISFKILEGSDILTAYRESYGVHSCMTGNCSRRQGLVGFYAMNEPNIKLVVGYIRNRPISRQLLWKTVNGWLLDRPYCTGNRKHTILDAAEEFLSLNGYSNIEYVYATNDDYPPNWEKPTQPLVSAVLRYDRDIGIPYLDSWTTAFIDAENRNNFKLMWIPDGGSVPRLQGFDNSDDIRNTEGGLRGGSDDDEDDTEEDGTDCTCQLCVARFHEDDGNWILHRSVERSSDVNPGYREVYVCPECFDGSDVIGDERISEFSQIRVVFRTDDIANQQDFLDYLDSIEHDYYWVAGSDTVHLRGLPEDIIGFTQLDQLVYTWKAPEPEFTDIDVMLANIRHAGTIGDGLRSYTHHTRDKLSSRYTTTVDNLAGVPVRPSAFTLGGFCMVFHDYTAESVKACIMPAIRGAGVTTRSPGWTVEEIDLLLSLRGVPGDSPTRSIIRRATQSIMTSVTFGHVYGSSVSISTVYRAVAQFTKIILEASGLLKTVENLEDHLNLVIKRTTGEPDVVFTGYRPETAGRVVIADHRYVLTDGPSTPFSLPHI